MQVQQPSPVRLIDVHRWYRGGDGIVPLLHGATAQFTAGTLSVVTGGPGVGLSTLLRCAAGLDQPTLGTVLIGGTELAALSAAGRARLRRRRVGYLPATPVLFGLLTAGQQVGLALRLAGLPASRQRQAEVLEQVGLAGRAGDRVGELSPGARQRVAIARTLAVRPDVLFADEPTDRLGPAAASTVLALLRRLADQDGLTVVLASRDRRVPPRCDQVLVLSGGRLSAAPCPARIPVLAAAS